MTTETAVCDECGFALDSKEHIEGRGLHGHTRTSKREADAQRAEVNARALEYAASVAAEAEALPKALASVVLLTEENAKLKAEIDALKRPRVAGAKS